MDSRRALLSFNKRESVSARARLLSSTELADTTATAKFLSQCRLRVLAGRRGSEVYFSLPHVLYNISQQKFVLISKCLVFCCSHFSTIVPWRIDKFFTSATKVKCSNCSLEVILSPWKGFETMESIESLDKECSALGGLFQQVVNDMKVRKEPFKGILTAL